MQQWVPPDQPALAAVVVVRDREVVLGALGSRSGSSATMRPLGQRERDARARPSRDTPLAGSRGRRRWPRGCRPPATGPSPAASASRAAPPPFAIVAARLPPVPISATGVMSVSPQRTTDVLEPHAELVRGHLRERRLVALAVGLLAGDDDQPRRRRRSTGTRSRRPAGQAPAAPVTLGAGAALEVGRHAEPEVAALGASCSPGAPGRRPMSTSARRLLEALLGRHAEEGLPGQHRRAAARPRST